MTTEVGKVIVKYNNGIIEDINFNMSLIPFEDELIKYQEKIKDELSSNDKEKINAAAQYILSNVFSKVTDLELRDFESSELTSKVFCNEEDGEVKECTIVYYLIEK